MLDASGTPRLEQPVRGGVRAFSARSGVISSTTFPEQPYAGLLPDDWSISFAGRREGFDGVSVCFAGKVTLLMMISWNIQLQAASALRTSALLPVRTHQVE